MVGGDAKQKIRGKQKFFYAVCMGYGITVVTHKQGPKNKFPRFEFINVLFALYFYSNRYHYRTHYHFQVFVTHGDTKVSHRSQPLPQERLRLWVTQW
jgi:hypothetical protein